MIEHPYAGTPQYAQAYPVRQVFYLLPSYGRKKVSGHAATGLRGPGWHKLGVPRTTTVA